MDTADEADTADKAKKLIFQRMAVARIRSATALHACGKATSLSASSALSAVSATSASLNNVFN